MTKTSNKRCSFRTHFKKVKEDMIEYFRMEHIQYNAITDEGAWRFEFQCDSDRKRAVLDALKKSEIELIRQIRKG